MAVSFLSGFYTYCDPIGIEFQILFGLHKSLCIVLFIFLEIIEFKRTLGLIQDL